MRSGRAALLILLTFGCLFTPLAAEAARSLGTHVNIVEARPPTQLEGAFSSTPRGGQTK